jgi:hypothetical protein
VPTSNAVTSREPGVNSRRSIQYAHYTAEDIVRAMWKGAEQFGFTGGHKIFEPGLSKRQEPVMTTSSSLTRLSMSEIGVIPTDRMSEPSR